MSPYRTAPEVTADPDPELDRVPIHIRFVGLRGGWIVVTRRTLRFEPRFLAAPRSVPIEQGLAGLKLPKRLDPRWASATIWPPVSADTIASWVKIITSSPYQEPLSAKPQNARFIMDTQSHYVCNDGEIASNPAFVVVFDDDRLVAFAGNRATFDECFATTWEWPDASARLLGRALVWLSTAELNRAVARMRERGDCSARVFTRTEVRARRIYGRRRNAYHHLGLEHDAVVLQPTPTERAALEHWLDET